MRAPKVIEFETRQLIRNANYASIPSVLKGEKQTLPSFKPKVITAPNQVKCAPTGEQAKILTQPLKCKLLHYHGLRYQSGQLCLSQQTLFY